MLRHTILYEAFRTDFVRTRRGLVKIVFDSSRLRRLFPQYKGRCRILFRKNRFNSTEKNKIILTGENLTLGKYFEEDLLIKGKIKGVEID